MSKHVRQKTKLNMLTLVIYDKMFFFLFELWGVKSKLGSLGTAATTDLLYLPRVIVRMEKLLD
jgi:hypothetical protein